MRKKGEDKIGLLCSTLTAITSSVSHKKQLFNLFMQAVFTDDGG